MNSLIFGLYRQRQRHQVLAILKQVPCLVPWPRRPPAKTIWKVSDNMTLLVGTKRMGILQE